MTCRFLPRVGLTITALLVVVGLEAQVAKAIVGGIIIGGAAFGANKAKHKNELSKAPTSDLQDISGTWVGKVFDPNSSWYCEVSFTKTGPNTYAGLDYYRLEEKKNNAPLQIGFNLKQTFTATYNNGILVYSNINNVDNPNFPQVVENLRLIREKSRDSSEFVNNNQGNVQREVHLKRTTMDLSPALAKQVETNKAVIIANTITDSTLEVESITYNSSRNNSVLRYNDHGQMTIKLRNHAGKDLTGIQINATTAEENNGLIGYDKFNGNVNLAKNSENSFNAPITTNFSVPRDSVHFTLVFKYNGFTVQRQLTLPTESYYKTNAVTLPANTSPRLQAVSGYYGIGNKPFTDVSKPLDGLAATGDKMALMWKAVFVSMGYGGYKIDEDQGYTLAKSCLSHIEEKARVGDGEALLLMFYACQMGLEGEDARALGANFLEKSALAGFSPAVYDYALLSTQHRDYASAFKYLTKSYESGVKEAAEVIGYMYEKGWGVSNDNDSAIAWYKRGISFGDPDATLWFAKLVAKGYGNNPPDINKALALSTEAAAKNCTDAMIFNGELYFDGKQGVARSIPTAIKWFRAAADLGDRQAMLTLGETYLAEVPGFTKDERSALFWIKKAAELGSPKAMVVLARFLHEGTVGEKNVIAARYWYNQAVLNGFARPDATGLNAQAETFMNFWKYADFSPSYIYVNEYGQKVADGDDGLMNGFVSGIFGAMADYYGHQQELINGLEFIGKKNGYKIYGGTVSSSLMSTLQLHQGQIINIKAYGIISTGMMSGPATADGLGPNWPEYRIIKDIPCSAVMGAVKDTKWQFIGQQAFYTAPKDGPLMLALNAIDYRNYKGYFDLVIRVPEN